jgi:hypothetical protein
MTFDLVLRNARFASADDLFDIGIRDSRFPLAGARYAVRSLPTKLRVQRRDILKDLAQGLGAQRQAPRPGLLRVVEAPRDESQFHGALLQGGSLILKPAQQSPNGGRQESARACHEDQRQFHCLSLLPAPIEHPIC